MNAATYSSQHTPFHSAQNAGQITHDILKSSEVERLWGVYHHSEADKNPAYDIAKKIQDIGSDLQDNPEVLSFMRELVKIERKALGKVKSKDTETDKALKKSMEGLENFLDLLAIDVNLPKPKKLPKKYKSLLGVLRHHTGQNKWGPVHTMRNILKETGHHVLEEVKEKPYSSAFLTLVSLSTLWFMNKKLGSSVTNYIDPEMMTVTNFSMGDLGRTDYEAALDSSFYNTELEASCHNHIKQILDFMGDDAAQSIAETPVAQMFFPNHCDRYKTLVPDAQNILQNTYDWWNTRVAIFSEDPVASLSDRVIPNSPFKESFDISASYTADFWYAANTLENVVFHTLVTFTGAAIAFKIGTLENEETSEHLNEMKDFAKRSWANSKLTYIFSAAGTAGAYMAQDGLTPWMVIMGLAGMGVGEVSHRIARKYNKKNFANKTIKASKKNIEYFSDPAAVVSKTRAGDDLKKPNWAERLWKKKKALTVTSALALTSAGDIVFNDGALTGYVTGGGLVTTLFACFNAVEDTAAHIIFGVVGGVVGLTAAFVKRGFIVGVNLSKKVIEHGVKQVTRRAKKKISRVVKGSKPRKDASKTQRPFERQNTIEYLIRKHSGTSVSEKLYFNNQEKEILMKAKLNLGCHFESVNKCGDASKNCPLRELCKVDLMAMRNMGDNESAYELS